MRTKGIAMPKLFLCSFSEKHGHKADPESPKLEPTTAELPADLRSRIAMECPGRSMRRSAGLLALLVGFALLSAPPSRAVTQAKLLASDGAAGDRFGSSVAISGDTVVIGARGDDDNGSMSGSAYVYRFNGTSWVETQKLLASDGADFEAFGGGVAVAGDTAVIGAYGDDDNALAETIIGLYKTEVIRRNGPWRSIEEVEFTTLEWVDWFNNRRLFVRPWCAPS